MTMFAARSIADGNAVPTAGRNRHPKPLVQRPAPRLGHRTCRRTRNPRSCLHFRNRLIIAREFSTMEACNDRYFFIQRLFGIGFRSSFLSIRSETFQASPSEDGTRFARSVRARNVRAVALRSLSLKEGRFRILTADDHEQSTRRREPGGIHERTLLTLQLSTDPRRNHCCPVETSSRGEQY